MRIRKLALAALGLAVSLAAATAPACADDIRNTAIVQPSRADGPGWRRASDAARPRLPPVDRRFIADRALTGDTPPWHCSSSPIWRAC